MANNDRIRWRDKDIIALKKTINNFNRRVERASKKSPDSSYLPKKLKFENEKKNIATRRDFNNFINSLNRFNAKTARPIRNAIGTITTQWQLYETNLRLRIINKKRRQQRENIDPYIGLDNTAESNSLKERKLNFEGRTQSDWDQFSERVEKQNTDAFKQKRIKQYKENYITAFWELIGDQELIKRLSKVPAYQLAEWIYTEPILSIDFIYDPLESQIKAEQISKFLFQKGY